MMMTMMICVRERASESGYKSKPNKKCCWHLVLLLLFLLLVKLPFIHFFTSFYRRQWRHSRDSHHVRPLPPRSRKWLLPSRRTIIPITSSTSSSFSGSKVAPHRHSLPLVTPAGSGLWHRRRSSVLRRAEHRPTVSARVAAKVRLHAQPPPRTAALCRGGLCAQ